MTTAEILLYLNTAIASIALLGHAKGYFSSGEKAIAKELVDLNEDGERHEDKLKELDRRVQAIEGELKHLPDRASQHRMELSLVEMTGRFAAIEERLKPIAATSERLHELLMEQARK